MWSQAAGVQWLDRGQHRLFEKADTAPVRVGGPPRLVDQQGCRCGAARREHDCTAQAAQGLHARAGLGVARRVDPRRPCRLPGHRRAVSSRGADAARVVGGGGIKPDGASGSRSSSVPSCARRARTSSVPEEANSPTDYSAKVGKGAVGSTPFIVRGNEAK